MSDDEIGHRCRRDDAGEHVNGEDADEGRSAPVFVVGGWITQVDAEGFDYRSGHEERAQEPGNDRRNLPHVIRRYLLASMSGLMPTSPGVPLAR